MQKLGTLLERNAFYLILVADLFRIFLKYNREKIMALKYGISIFNFRPNNFIKTSNENKLFFILGSGSSINKLSKKDWSLIEKNCSIGINKWITHPFEPNYLMTEGIGTVDENSSNYKWYVKYMSIYAESSRSTILFRFNPSSIINLKNFSTLGHKKVFIIPRFSIPGRSNQSRRRAMRILDKLKIANNYPLFSRASVTVAISIGYLLGFKKIILCGIDLKNSKYFFEDKEFKSHPQIPIPPSSGQPNQQEIHLTVNEDIHPITVDRSILDYYEQILINKGVKLYVNSEESMLFPRIQVFEWDQFKF